MSQIDPRPYQLCLTTVDNKSTAKELALNLLQQKLVACVNIIGKGTSIYRWQDEIVEDEEFVLLMKTRQDRVSELQAALLQAHSYDVPEFICIDINSGSDDYLNWLNEQLD